MLTLRVIYVQGVHLQGLRVEGVPWFPLTSPDLSGGSFSLVRVLGRRQRQASTPWQLRPMWIDAEPGRGWREKGNGLSAEHPESHPLSWGGERKRRTRGKRRRTNQRKSRCDRRVWVMEAKGRWFITEEAGVNNIKYGKFRWKLTGPLITSSKKVLEVLVTWIQCNDGGRSEA